MFPSRAGLDAAVLQPGQGFPEAAETGPPGRDSQLIQHVADHSAIGGSGPRCFASGRLATGRASAASAGAGLITQGLGRRGPAAFPFQRFDGGLRTGWRRGAVRRCPALCGVASGLLARSRRNIFGWRKFDACAARFRQSDGDRLFGGASPVLTFTDVVHFFFDELPGLG